MRHEKYYSSVDGDTSEASTAMHNPGSVNESEDAVRAWSSCQRGPQTWIDRLTRTSLGLSRLCDCGMATCRELIGSYLDR